MRSPLQPPAAPTGSASAFWRRRHRVASIGSGRPCPLLLDEVVESVWLRLVWQGVLRIHPRLRALAAVAVAGPVALFVHEAIDAVVERIDVLPGAAGEL